MTTKEGLVDLLRKKSTSTSYVLIQDLPSKPKLKMLEIELKDDARGNEGLFITYETQDDNKVVQKYGVTSYSDLADMIEKAGGEQYLKDNFVEYQKMTIGRQERARVYPLPKA